MISSLSRSSPIPLRPYCKKSPKFYGKGAYSSFPWPLVSHSMSWKRFSFVSWLVRCHSFDWLIDCSVYRLIDWLIDWLVDWLIDWLITGNGCYRRVFCLSFFLHRRLLADMFEWCRYGSFCLEIFDFAIDLRCYRYFQSTNVVHSTEYASVIPRLRRFRVLHQLSLQPRRRPIGRKNVQLLGILRTSPGIFVGRRDGPEWKRSRIRNDCPKFR